MKKTIVIGVLAVLVLLGIGTVVAFKVLSVSGFAKDADQTFGDQHLRTAVALIELHKVRNGHYPQSLSDIRFSGDWDRLALNSVTYQADAGGTSYFVEVKRGWIGKPDLQMPAEFWQGTGYNAALKPAIP